VSKIGLEQTPEDQEDGPPELLFVHGGHTSRPTDLSWNMNEEWTMGTAAEDNVLQVWRPSRSLWSTDDIAIDIEDLE
jgi:histone-binding protein RBBP4